MWDDLKIRRLQPRQTPTVSWQLETRAQPGARMGPVGPRFRRLDECRRYAETWHGRADLGRCDLQIRRVTASGSSFHEYAGKEQP